ncbi:MAG TPA: hypothetical protein VNB52_04620 [Ilumatobacteraceae bacterium]|nr:hypothetical protein [Ilumatobacteraceae bacterium]
MSDSPPADALTVLTYALDEMRETTTLLPVAEASRSSRRPWWRNVFFGFARSNSEVTAGLAVQYLGENIDRARGHWREVLSLMSSLQRDHGDNEVVALLGHQLDAAGINEILPKLRHDAIPRPIARTAAHLEGVVSTIRDCDRLAQDARNKLTLQRMRNE